MRRRSDRHRGPGPSAWRASMSSSRSSDRLSTASRRSGPPSRRRTTGRTRRRARRERCSARFPSPSPPAVRSGLRLAATYGHGLGHHRADRSRRPHARDDVGRRAEYSCPCWRKRAAAVGREPESIGKVLLWTPTEPVITSLDQFDELERDLHAELGFDQFVLHHPAQTGPYAGNVAAFEQIAARAADGTGATD